MNLWGFCAGDVSARCVARRAVRGRSLGQNIRSAGLNPDEVEQLQREAEIYAEQDRIAKEKISTRVQAENLCAEAQRTIQKYADRVDKAYVDKVTHHVELVKESLEQGETEDLKALVAGLDVSLLEFGGAIHSGKKMDRPAKRQRTTQSGPIELGETTPETEMAIEEDDNGGPGTDHD